MDIIKRVSDIYNLNYNGNMPYLSVVPDAYDIKKYDEFLEQDTFYAKSNINLVHLIIAMNIHIEKEDNSSQYKECIHNSEYIYINKDKFSEFYFSSANYNIEGDIEYRDEVNVELNQVDKDNIISRIMSSFNPLLLVFKMIYNSKYKILCYNIFDFMISQPKFMFSRSTYGEQVLHNTLFYLCEHIITYNLNWEEPSCLHNYWVRIDNRSSIPSNYVNSIFKNNNHLYFIDKIKDKLGSTLVGNILYVSYVGFSLLNIDSLYQRNYLYYVDKNIFSTNSIMYSKNLKKYLRYKIFEYINKENEEMAYKYYSICMILFKDRKYIQQKNVLKYEDNEEVTFVDNINPKDMSALLFAENIYNHIDKNKSNIKVKRRCRKCNLFSESFTFFNCCYSVLCYSCIKILYFNLYSEQCYYCSLPYPINICGVLFNVGEIEKILDIRNNMTKHVYFTNFIDANNFKYVIDILNYKIDFEVINYILLNFVAKCNKLTYNIDMDYKNDYSIPTYEEEKFFYILDKNMPFDFIYNLLMYKKYLIEFTNALSEFTNIYVINFGICKYCDNLRQIYVSNYIPYIICCYYYTCMICNISFQYESMREHSHVQYCCSTCEYIDCDKFNVCKVCKQYNNVYLNYKGENIYVLFRNLDAICYDKVYEKLNVPSKLIHKILYYNTDMSNCFNI